MPRLPSSSGVSERAATRSVGDKVQLGKRNNDERMNSHDDQVPAFTDRDIFIASGRGATVAVRDHGGGGPAVVLLHGAGLNLSMQTSLRARRP